MKKNFAIGALMVVPVLLSGCFSDDDVQPGLEQKFLQETQVIDEYLEDNNLNADVDSYSLLRYEVLQEGTGLAPYIANSVTISYRINLLSTGEEVAVVEEETVDWEDLILGLQVGLRIIQEGGHMILYVPSVVAYGDEGEGNIPPDAILVYEVILHSFAHPQLKSDVNAIQTYLDDNEIAATRTPSGVFILVNEEGTGTAVTWGSSVTIDYEGRFFGSQNVFDSGTGVTYNLSGLITGWQIGLQGIRSGSDVTLYIPSTFGYGTEGSGSTIPPNTNLEFDINLKSVFN